MLAGQIIDIRPQLDFNSEMDFTYPVAEEILQVEGQEVLSILESLAEKGILKKVFFDRFLRCPRCRSVNLRPTTHCPKCGSANTARVRVLDHFIYKYVGIEDEFVSQGKYVCPQCNMELRTVGNDY